MCIITVAFGRLFWYLFLVFCFVLLALGLIDEWTVPSCSSLAVMCRLLVAVASLVAEHKLQKVKLSSCRARV